MTRYLMIAGAALLLLTFIITVGTAAAFDADTDEQETCFFRVETSPYYELLISAAVFFSLSVLLIITSIATFKVNQKNAPLSGTVETETLEATPPWET